ncbi:MAG: polyribonucleotide nucleotidyltransferase [Sulfurovum sp.]|nr:polyribonucleotide nucleotidyltransferase [Sulfurovum sp.]
MNEQIVEIDINNLQESYVFNKIAKQASGAVWYKQGKAVLMATVAIDEKAVEEDFLPMTIQYIEKSYAAAKIPGGFIKRETKPGDFETLTSRIIDRSLRPLFPKGFRYPISIAVTVLSSDREVDMQVAALHAASAALFVSDTPVSQTISAVRVGQVAGELIVNPSNSQLDDSQLDLFVVGSDEDILMIEMRTIASEVVDDVIGGTIAEMPIVLEHHECNELDEDELISAITLAQNAISASTAQYSTKFSEAQRVALSLEFSDEKIDSTLYAYIENNFKDAVENAVKVMAKSERSISLQKVRNAIIEAKSKEGEELDKDIVTKVLDAYKRSIVRSLILDQNIRADGRGMDEIRPIEIETNLLPSVHGSCLFTRGQTQALVAVTLGDSRDAQSYELVTDKESQYEHFMVHYNFPGYAVGEASYIGAPGRRELGHGNLAKRALEPTIDIKHDGTIRVVSEVLESNGSSSMATVCGGSLALRAADVEVQKLVSGIAMGLVMEDDKYAILSDIVGLEDHDGDMDFKITGTKDGITAMQMDIKLGGIELSILKEALAQAKEGRLHILSLMEAASEAIKPSGALPNIEFFNIDPSKIVDIIGKAGSTIREIIEKFGVTIDLDRDVGGVKVAGDDKEMVTAAKEHINTIASAPTKKQMQYTIGETYNGNVKKIVDFGMFVEMPDGFDALLHISKVRKERVNNLQELYSEGDDIAVIVLEQKGKKVELATEEYYL